MTASVTKKVLRKTGVASDTTVAKVASIQAKNPIPRILKPVAVLHNIETDIYSTSAVRFSFLGKPVTKKQLPLPSVNMRNSLVTCREDLARNFRDFVTAAGDPAAQSSVMDTDNFRLAINYFLSGDDGDTEEVQEKALFKRVKWGVRLMNFLSQNIAGWGQVKVYRLPVYRDSVEMKLKQQRFFMVVGPRQWLNTTHYISLAGLCIRCGNISELNRYATESGLIGRVGEFVNQPLEDVAPTRRSQASTDLMHIRNTYKFWPLLVREQNKILGVDDTATVDLKKFYNLSRLGGGTGYNEGVVKLVNGETSDAVLSKNFSDLKVKALKGKL